MHILEIFLLRGLTQSFLTLPCTVHEEDGFIAPTAASNFDLNIDLEEEEAGTTHARIRVVLFQLMP
jgi:hypothetical protein